MPNTLIDNAESTNKRLPGRKGRKRQNSIIGPSKRMIRAINKKYIEDVNKKSEYPNTFVYSKLIDLVKENFKEFFIDPDDIVLNNNAQINRKKGKKYTLSSGAYEYGDGFFDLKFDGKFGFRQNSIIRDKRSRIPISNINKANHFWWIISKAYLNKFLLEDAKQTLKAFVDDSLKQPEDNVLEEEKEIPNKIKALFNSKWIDFQSLTKSDPDLEGLNEKDLQTSKLFPQFLLNDNKLWQEDSDYDESENNDYYERQMEFYKAKVDNASENDINNVINLIDDRFKIEQREWTIGKLNISYAQSNNLIAKKAAAFIGETVPEDPVNYEMDCSSQNWYVHDQVQLKENMKSFKENKINEWKTIINSLIELHSLKFIDDQCFYSDLKIYMDKLDLLNREDVVIDDNVLNEKDEANGNQLDDVIKSLQSQLVESKSENIKSFQNLMKETESHIITQQSSQLDKRNDYVKNWIVPLKDIYNKLYEECVSLE